MSAFWSVSMEWPMVILYLGQVYVARRLYASNGGLLLYTLRGEVYVNPDGREVRA